MTQEMLEVVDEHDVVVGIAPRKEIHAKGLLHRETAIFFVTPAGEIIFQRRSMTKDTFPGCLDATTAGHVEIGKTYAETAMQEIKEETGLTVAESDLVLLSKDLWDHKDPATQTHNRRFSTIYGYIFDGQMNDLIVETDKADGFEMFRGETLFAMTDIEQQTIPLLTSDAGVEFYRKLLNLVKPS